MKLKLFLTILAGGIVSGIVAELYGVKEVSLVGGLCGGFVNGMYGLIAYNIGKGVIKIF